MLMADIADSFRIEIIKAVRMLAATYPSKHRVMLTFLAAQLREEASFDVKKDLVDSLASLVKENPNAQESGLLHLCEFIEDCEYPTLCIKVLSLLGELAPNTSCPSKYIRFIYNRLILENAAVRAAAVHALTTVGFHCPQLRRDVSTLLESCLVDNDDEIRERARLYFKALNKSLKDQDTESISTTDSALTLHEVLTSTLPVSLDALIDFTQNWLESSAAAEGRGLPPLDLSQIPSEEEYTRLKQAASSEIGVTVSGRLLAELHAVASSLCPDEDIGVLDHSTKPVYLTEKEAEYSVLCVKHIFFSDYIILEFQITNTMPDQSLQNVEVVPSNFNSALWAVLGSSCIESLPFDQPMSTYTVLRKLSPHLITTQQVPFSAPTDTFNTTMTFVVCEADDEFGYDDSYVLEPVTISIADYLIPKTLRPGQFKPQWAALGDSGEAVAKLSLNYRTLEAAVTGLIELLNLSACEGLEKVDNTRTAHD